MPARAQTNATDAPRVRIQRPLNGDELVDEAVIRILGELSAVGLDVEVLHRSITPTGELPPLEQGTYGLLVIRREAQWVHLDTWAPDGGAPYSQHLDATSPQVNAEVIAVRAVEALRAKWLEYGELSDSELPSEVREFTRIGTLPAPTPTPRPEPPPPPPPPVEPKSAVVEPPPARTPVAIDIPPPPEFDIHAWTLQVLVGPTLMLEGQAGNNLGAQGAALFGKSGFYAGAGVAGALQRPRVESTAGSAEVGRTRFLGLLRAEVKLGRVASSYLMAGLGMDRYVINATANDAGLEARDSVMHRFSGGAQLGAVLWLTPVFGLFGEAEVSGLAQSMVIRMDERDVYTFGGPTAAFGMGVTLRQAVH